MTRTRILCALSLLLLFPAITPAKDAPAGIVRLSEKITGALDRIEKKLRQDERAWQEAMEFYFGAVESELARARLKRREFRHAELALRLRTSWAKEPFRTAVLMRLAEIDLAADEVSAAQLRRLREIDGRRRAELDRLISLVSRLRIGQVELTRYLSDTSLSRRVGEIDLSRVALAVSEARRLRRPPSVEQEQAEADIEEERNRLEEAVKAFREFLDVVDRVIELVPAGE
ncbi:MAG: hypothetical protein OXH11_17050 [Candidatus Aminicenantes bacterium]|nr:hypothetical protein [Candidatus Aminicenantes bacterium]